MSVQSFDWLAHHAATRPDREAVVDLGTNRRFTWEQLNDRTSRLATALSGTFGVERGDRVAVLAHNNSNTFEVQFACWKLGAVFVPLNWRLAVPELQFILGDAEPQVLIHDEPFGDASVKVAELTGIEHLINWDGGAATPANPSADYEEAIEASHPLDGSIELCHADPVTIMYTSGTTGRPKGAIITQGMTFWNAVNSVEFFNIGTNTTNLAFLPLFHTGGLNCWANPAFHFGGRNIVMREFEPSSALELITNPDHGVTHFLGVPANFLFIFHSSKPSA